MNNDKPNTVYSLETAFREVVQAEIADQLEKVGPTIQVQALPPIMEYKSFAELIRTTPASLRGWLDDPKRHEWRKVKAGNQIFVDVTHLMESIKQ